MTGGSLSQLSAEPIFVGGHVRSGTTWVYDLLTSHELVAGAFETWMFSTHHGVGGVFAREQWDPELTAKMTERAGRPYGLRQFGTREEIAADIRRLVEQWLGRVLEPSHRFLVEKTPPHLMGMNIVSEVFPDARFVHVVRDGRDVAVSLRAAARGWNPNFAHMDGRLFRPQAESWQRTVGRISGAGAAMGDRYLEVRYEDLHARPEESVSRLLTFCRIPHDSPTVEQIVESNRFSKQFSPSEDVFRRKGKVGDWRDKFNLLSAFEFDRVAGARLVEKGYESDRRWWMRAR